MLRTALGALGGLAFALCGVPAAPDAEDERLADFRWTPAPPRAVPA